MYKRRTLTLLLAFLLVLSYAAGASAAGDKAEAAYLRDLKKVEDFLRKNHDAAHLGDKAYDYIRKNLRDMDLKRLETNLRTFLRCGPGVPMPNMLEAYTREIQGDYESIYQRAAGSGKSPETVAEENRYERGMLGAQYGTKSDSGKKSPAQELIIVQTITVEIVAVKAE